MVSVNDINHVFETMVLADQDDQQPIVDRPLFHAQVSLIQDYHVLIQFLQAAIQCGSEVCNTFVHLHTQSV
jgi:hypothetical protein